jgi:hypothetical protein
MAAMTSAAAGEIPTAGQGEGLSQSQMQASLAAAKESRKRAELDAQLLANRIALLKQEEEKAWKKIEETRKRANEITDLRAQNEQKFAAKEEFYKNKWDSIKAAQTKNHENREKSRAVREAARNGLMDARHSNAARSKQQSHQILQSKKEREAQERLANLERGDMIKQKKEEARRRMEYERIAALERAREEYEQRATQEDLLRSRTEALVANMEKEEMELIQRLQNTQTVQRNAYEELEAALGQSTQPGMAGFRNPDFRVGAVGEKMPMDADEPRPAA